MSKNTRAKISTELACYLKLKVERSGAGKSDTDFSEYESMIAFGLLDTDVE